MDGAPVSPSEPPHTSTLPAANLVEARPRRGIRPTTRSAISPIRGSRRAAGRDPDVDHPAPRRRASCRDRSIALAWPAWNVAVARAATATPATSPVDASTPLGTSQATTTAPSEPACVDRGDRRRRRLARLPREPGAQDRVDDRRGPRQPAAVEQDRRRTATGADKFVAASPRSSSPAPSSSTSTDTPPLPQHPRGDQPVPAVVALAAHDRDPPGRGQLGDKVGQPRSGPLHQLDPRDPALADRPLVERTLLARVGEWVKPVGKLRHRPGG